MAYQCCCIMRKRIPVPMYRSLWYSLAFVYVFFYSSLSNKIQMFDGSYLGLSTSFQKRVKDKAFSYKWKRHYGDTSVYCSSCALCKHYSTTTWTTVENYTLYENIYQIVIMLVSDLFFCYLYTLYMESLLHPKQQYRSAYALKNSSINFCLFIL